jgi:hypothetical protein
MNLERLINGALIGALVGVGISATSDASSRITQRHLKGYENLEGEGANLAFKVQTEFGEEATKRLIMRMDELASLAAIMEAGNDIEVDVILATADRAHHVYDRMRKRINILNSTDTGSPTSKETLAQVLEWAQCQASNIDVLVRQNGKVTTAPVPCEFEEKETQQERVVEQPPPPPQGLLGVVGSLVGNLFANKK